MICLIRPEDDVAAEGASAWWNQVGECPAGVAILDLRKGITRREVEDAVSGTKLVLYFGHGTDSALSLADGDVFLNRENISRARHSVVVAIACSSANELGEDAVQPDNGVLAYLGFTDLLWTVPAFHEAFGRPIAMGIAALFSGRSLAEAEATIRLHFENLAHALDEHPHPDAVFASLLAWTNHDNLTLKGNQQVCLIW